MPNDQMSRRRLAAVGRARRCPKRCVPVIVSLFVLALLAAGCNNSRYGVTYDDRYPEIRRIAVLPAAIEAYSLHSGGVLERRPDMEPELAQKTLANIEEIVWQRGYETMTLFSPATDPDSGDEKAKRFALLAAVRDAILTHHYEHGKARVFDYETGDAPGVICGAKADAVLCVYVKGVVPTGGRQFLRGTALVVGVLTGIHVYVPTHEAAMTLMLVDAKDGRVLWFNIHRAETDSSSDRSLRPFIREACSYLLKARN